MRVCRRVTVERLEQAGERLERRRAQASRFHAVTAPAASTHPRAACAAGNHPRTDSRNCYAGRRPFTVFFNRLGRDVGQITDELRRLGWTAPWDALGWAFGRAAATRSRHTTWHNIGLISVRT